MSVAHTRYHSAAIALHWVMAVAILVMLASGVTMSYFEIPQALKFSMYQWHKSLGVLILIAFFLRLGIRLWQKPPALPAHFKQLDIIGAKLGHFGLYALMFLMPLSGWLMVSSSVYGLPTIVFGLFEWPHIPGVAGNESISNLAKTAHWLLAISIGLLITAHSGAVIKHFYCDKENLLMRMWWVKGK